MPAIGLASLTLIGGGLCFLLIHLVRGSRYLAAAMLASFALRIALALALYLASALELPLLHTLQLPDGFWRFAYDGPHYHENGIRLAEAFRSGVEMPQVMFGDEPFQVKYYDYFHFVGLVYWAFGPHPLQIPFLNSALWTATAVLGYVLARRMGGETAGRVSATAIAFWPSTFIWSSQILKDGLVLLLLVAILLLVTLTFHSQRRLALSAAVGSMPLLFLLTRLREELGFVLVVAALTWMVLAMLVSRRATAGVAAAGTGLLIVLFFAPSIDPVATLYSPQQTSASLAGVSGTRQSPTQTIPLPVVETRTARQSVPSGLRTVVEAIEARAQSFSVLGVISSKRRGYSGSGGDSAFGTEVQFSEGADLVYFLPQGLAYALYAPFPWQWFSPEGDTGIFKSLAGVETVLIALLTPFILFGMLKAVTTRDINAWLLVIFAIIALVGMALTITNVGTLYRLRLQALLPLVIVASAYGMPLDRLRGLLGHGATLHKPERPQRLAAPHS